MPTFLNCGFLEVAGNGGIPVDGNFGFGFEKNNKRSFQFDEQIGKVR